jgi:hypothetical protein
MRQFEDGAGCSRKQSARRNVADQPEVALREGASRSRPWEAARQGEAGRGSMPVADEQRGARKVFSRRRQPQEGHLEVARSWR